MDEVLEQVLFAFVLLSLFSPDILQPVFQIAGSPCQYFPLALALLSKATLEELLRLEIALFA